MRIEKTAFNQNDIPDIETLCCYVDALKLYLQEHPSTNDQNAELIENLPSSRKIRQDFSNEECKILFETVDYLWKEITKQSITTINKVNNYSDKLLGNYWLIKNGILLEGPNHYTIIKNNTMLLASLLNLNGFALQCYLAREPNKVINYIIRNGGIRMFVRKGGKAFLQMSEETYVKWGKAKIKKMDFNEKIVKILDPDLPYKGWKSGITIKILSTIN